MKKNKKEKAQKEKRKEPACLEQSAGMNYWERLLDFINRQAA